MIPVDLCFFSLIENAKNGITFAINFSHHNSGCDVVKCWQKLAIAMQTVCLWVIKEMYGWRLMLCGLEAWYSCLVQFALCNQIANRFYRNVIHEILPLSLWFNGNTCYTMKWIDDNNVFHELKDDALQCVIDPKYPDIQLEMLPSIFPRKKNR